MMVSWLWLVIAVVVTAIIVAGVMLFMHRRRSVRLRRRFGREYDRAVETRGDRREAEYELESRERRVRSLEIRSLQRDEQERFAGHWRAVQARFVDDPGGAVAEADVLVADLMRTRGYPVGDFEQRAADVSVDHPQVVDNYRAAHGIALRHGRGEANTEDLRKAMVHFRALFEDLLGERVRVAGRSSEVER
jgi:hypothetical protein